MSSNTQKTDLPFEPEQAHQAWRDWTFRCPWCKTLRMDAKGHLGCTEVYVEDGDEVEVECGYCHKPVVLTYSVIVRPTRAEKGWVESDDDVPEGDT